MKELLSTLQIKRNSAGKRRKICLLSCYNALLILWFGIEKINLTFAYYKWIAKLFLTDTEKYLSSFPFYKSRFTAYKTGVITSWN